MSRALRTETEALRRAVELLRATESFIRTNPIAEYTVDYDETTCDGYCLADDCAVLVDEATGAIKAAEVRASDLLEACKQLTLFMRMYGSVFTCSDSYQNAMAAIARAENRTPEQTA